MNLTLFMLSEKHLCFCGIEMNVTDLVSGGALWELVRISRECSREDIRMLAHRMLAENSIFQAELRRLHIVL